ncbi:MAG TPA: hypothetical protein EYQ21_04125 [Flavobacteriales bacterium]|nr:hypothetical protein [Flavobacteriales bacterium]
MAKFQLDMEIECDFDLLGIGSHVGSHRMAWELNRIFGWQLVFDQEIVSRIKDVETRHIVLRYCNDEEGLDIALILNRVPEGVLATGAASLDYLLRLGAGILESEDVINRIRKSNLVTLVTNLNPEQSGALEAMFELDR